METLSFTFITEWMDDFVGLLQTNAVTIIGAGLVILALVVGAFWLIGLGKKTVKKANG